MPDAGVFRYNSLPREMRLALDAHRLVNFTQRQAASTVPALFANNLIAALKTQKAKGIYIVKRNNDSLLEGKLHPAMTMNEAAQVWKTVMQFSVGSISYVSPGTLGDYKEKLKALCRYFGPKRLSDINPNDLREYQQKRASGDLTDPEWKKPRTKLGPGPSAYRINKEVELLIRVLLRARAWTPEIAELYVPLKVEMRDIPRAMSPGEQQRFLKIAASKEEWALIHSYSVLALHTCMSTLEMRNLRRRDINPEQGVVVVRARGAKNPYRIRSIPLDSEARIATDWLLKHAVTIGSLQPEDCVFPFREPLTHEFVASRSMSESGLKYHWDQVRKAADLPWLRPYDLRHTAITRFAEAGTPVSVIMEFAGHVSLKMCTHYTHISEQAKRMAAEKVGTAIGQRNQNDRAPIPAPTANRNGNGGIHLGSLIDNLRAAGMDSESILQLIKASSG